MALRRGHAGVRRGIALTPLRGASAPGSLAAGILVAAALATTALVWRHADFVPIWDGRIYADCVIDAASRPFALEALRCAEHPSHAYVGVLAALQRLDPGNGALLIGANFLLFALASLAFHRLLGRLFSGEGQAPERALLTFGFAVQPAFVASIIQPGLDFGVLVFFVIALWAAVEDRLVALGIAGIFLCFSKESGVLVYAMLAGALAVVHLARAGGSPVRTMARLAPLIAPPVLFVAYLWWRSLDPSRAVLWNGSEQHGLLSQFVSLRLDSFLASYAALMFVVSFGWVMSVVVAADLLEGARRSLRRLASRPMADANPEGVLLCSLLLAGCGYVLSRYTTYSNLRYFLPVYALLPIAFYAALLRFQWSVPARRAILTVVGVLLLASNVRTLDPVSRAIFGTFDAGGSRMLRITSLSGECCGFGRDQLVYNLQFAGLHDAQNAVLRDNPVGAGATYSMDPFADWHVWSQVDAATGRRTLRRRNSVIPREVNAGYLRQDTPPDRVIYLDFPNVDDAAALAFLARFYDVSPATRSAARGVAIDVRHLRLRPTEPRSP